jgi:hypothetical protein
MAQGSNPRYALYAELPRHVCQLTERIRDRLSTVVGIKVVTERPHFTIVFGPELEAGKPEAIDRESAAGVYPNLMGHAADAFEEEDIYFCGVSHFLRRDAIHIHLEYTSKSLTKLQVDLRNQDPGLQRDYARYDKDAGDSSYANPPLRWLHVSLASVPRQGGWENAVIAVEDAVRDVIAEESIRDDACLRSFAPEGLTVVSAVTDTEVRVCGTSHADV